MRISSVLLTAGLAAIASQASGSEGSNFDSLQDYCVQTHKDTRENCECGQATADRIMTPQEQRIALDLMLGNRQATEALGDQRDEFFSKLSQVTAGCG